MNADDYFVAKDEGKHLVSWTLNGHLKLPKDNSHIILAPI